MTEKEIKKGLECCKTDWCVRCPYFEYVGCEVGLKQDAHNLITKQEKKIVQLKDELKQLKTNSKILARGVRDLNHENYKLTEKIKQAHEQRVKEINQLKTECTLLDDELRIARQGTIDVLNKLKSKCHNYYPSIDHYCCSVKAVNLSDIDELIKELIKNAEDKS